MPIWLIFWMLLWIVYVWEDPIHMLPFYGFWVAIEVLRHASDDEAWLTPTNGSREIKTTRTGKMMGEHSYQMRIARRLKSARLPGWNRKATMRKNRAQAPTWCKNLRTFLLALKRESNDESMLFEWYCIPTFQLHQTSESKAKRYSYNLLNWL